MNFAQPVLLSVYSFCLIVLGNQLTFGEEPARKTRSPQSASPLVEQYLLSGKLAEGEQSMMTHLKEHPEDNEARFGLGMIQFLRGIERLAQSFYRYGLQNENSFIGSELPFLRLPVPKNENPEEITYQKFRAIFQTLQTDLSRAETTLAFVKSSDVKLRIHFAQIRLDLDGDGKATSTEMLWNIYKRFNRQAAELEVPGQEGRRRNGEDGSGETKRKAGQHATEAKQADEWADQFAITFDNADATWLRGYCHLLMAFDEFMLAHDWEDAFNRVGFRLFPNTDTGYEILATSKKRRPFDEYLITDAIAFIHLIRFPVKEPKRMQASLKHFEEVFRLSRQMWKEVGAETDDVEEWIPSPTQTGVIPNVRITKQLVKSWHEFLDEAEAIFAGKKLIPHWRVKDGRGFNLRKYFLESKRFDLVLLIQGSDALPFLEKGTLTEQRFWSQLQNTFQGGFVGFAIWFN